jgi:hypothetical protein
MISHFTDNINKRCLSLKPILNYLAVFIVFGGGFVFGSPLLFEIRGSYLIMGLILLLWFPVLKDIIFNKVFLVPFAVLVIFSLYNVLRGLDTLPLLLKQTVGIMANAWWFYIFIKLNHYDIKGLFKIYLNIAFVVALIGIIQEISYLIAFAPGYNYKIFIPFWGLHFNQAHSLLRVNSILPEPAGFCVALLPAVFVSISSFLKPKYRIISRLKALVIIISFVLSFSSTGYAGLFVAIFLATFSRKSFRSVVVAVLLILIVFSVLYYSANDFKLRVDDSLKVIRGQISLKDANFSTFVLSNCTKVAWNSFKSAPLIGSGLGSFELNYQKFITHAEGTYGGEFIIIKDGASLLLRLIPELGSLGLTLLLLFIFKYFLMHKNNTDGHLWIINRAVFLVFLIRLLRVGHYFTDGFFLFFWMYYFSSLQAKEVRCEIA